MNLVARIAAQSACPKTGAGAYDVLCADPECFFIRCVLTHQLVGSRGSAEAAIGYARSRAIVYDRGSQALDLAA